MDFVYQAEFFLKDGTTVLKDMEVPGWLTPELLSQTTRISLIAKDGAVTTKGTPYPLVCVGVPEGCEAVIKSRVFGRIVGGAQFRMFGIGYKKGDDEHWTWVLPTGDIEIGEDGFLGQLYLRSITE